MARMEMTGLVLLAAIVACGPGAAATRHHAGGRRHHARGAHARHAGRGVARPYSSSVSPTITCRYADGTPYDPDIIGGPNHVGAGGPAANLGGFNPCGY